MNQLNLQHCLAVFWIRHIPQLAEDGLDMKNALSEFSDLIGVEVTDQFVSENNPLVVAGNQLLHSSGTILRKLW